MYYKGANMLNTIREVVHDDERWRGILRGLQSTFRHQVVTGKQVEDYISAQSGIDLSPVFAQYLTTTRVPVLEYGVADGMLHYRWTNVVPGFDMPVRVTIGSGGEQVLHPTESWSTEPAPGASAAEVKVNLNFYVLARAVDAR
jgi:aminopeptidase N